MPAVPHSRIARQLGVEAATLRRWVRDGVVPLPGGEWSPAAIAHARIVARLRERGHSLAEIRRASDGGRLAYGFVEDLFPTPEGDHTLEDAAAATGLEPALIERLWTAAGLSASTLDRLSAEDVDLLRDLASVLAAGLPLVAVLQLVRVYGQALARLADAEVRLFHQYVHEPLMRDGVPGLVMAEEMEGLAGTLMPLASSVMDRLHHRTLRHFVEQDVVGHMEQETAGDVDLGRVRVAIAFADLAGYTQLTEEAGDEQALDLVERFVAVVEATLPDDARVVKTIGDEAMIVGADPSALVDWAVTFQAGQAERPLPRIGMHHGAVLYRDGDYYGHEVNVAARVGARAAGGEVLVTRPIVESADRDLEFDLIGEVKLKGLSGATELFLAGRGK
jgi:adenylate cyclase